MSGHDEYEMQIEMRLHGALDAAAVATLDAHLASCAPCRRLQEVAKNTEEVMTFTADEHAGAMSWDRISSGIRNAESNYRLSIAGMAVVASLGAIVVGMFAGWPWLLLEIASSGAIIGAFAVNGRPWASGAMAAAAGHGDQLAIYREMVTRQVGRIRRLTPWIAGLGATLAGLKVLEAVLSPEQRAWKLLGAAVFLFFPVLAAWLRLVALPRLERERAELE